jgi:hypothetical protein
VSNAAAVLIGNAVKWSVVFLDESGGAIDPTVVTFWLVAPDGSMTIFTYGTDAEVVRDDEGEYHIWRTPGVAPDPLLLGAYSGHFWGTGNVTAHGCATVEITDECIA